MEGTPDPGVKNYLSQHWSLGQRVDAEDVMRSLQEHPGWALMEELVDQAIATGEKSLARLAHKTALGCTPQQAIDYAQKSGVQNGLSFHRDVVASVVASAEKAKVILKSADSEETAERS